MVRDHLGLFSRIIRTRGVPEARLRMIPNSVDTSLFRPLPRENEFARQHGLVDGFVVLYGGNIGLSQDWESFMRAAEELARLPIQFVVVGGGVRGAWLEQECAARKLANVRLLGYPTEKPHASGKREQRSLHDSHEGLDNDRHVPVQDLHTHGQC